MKVDKSRDTHNSFDLRYLSITDINRLTTID